VARRSRQIEFSLILPTHRRTEQLRRFLDSIQATAHNLARLEVILVVDDDDDESLNFQYDGLNLKSVRVPRGRSMGQLNMAGYHAATGRYLMLVNDDIIVRTAGWDEQMLAAFHSCPDGIVLVHVNDLLFRETLCVFPCLTREFCLLTGGICKEGYLRYRIDDHIHNIFDLLSLLGHDRRIYLPQVVFEHTNVERNTAGVAQYVLDPAIQEIDTKLFDSLLEERRQVALEAMGLIDSRLGSEKQSIWKKRLDQVTDSVAIRRPEHARHLPTAPVSGQEPRVTIGVVSADSRTLFARECIERIKTHTTNYDLILLDNNGDANFNHSSEMNRLLSICRTDYLVLMDDDVFVEGGWLEGMLRCMGPGVGVVTPLHKNREGHLTYAGIVMSPDDSGVHTHIIEAPLKPRRIETLCSAIMLIDIPKCGHIRLDERYTKYFLDIDYGLRVWEEGYEVVCSPFSIVTHLAGATLDQRGPRSAQLFEEQRQRYFEAWVTSGRIYKLKGGIWKTIPEIARTIEKAEEIDRFIAEGAKQPRDDFMRAATQLIRSLEPYPVFRLHITARAIESIGAGPVRVDDPVTGHIAFLLGLAGLQPVLFEEDFEGMNIILQHFRYYALPQGEGEFNYKRMSGNGYSRSFEADSSEAVKTLILQFRDSPPGRHVIEGYNSAVSHMVPPAVEHTPTGDPQTQTTPEPNVSETEAQKGPWPDSLFDPVYYLATNPEVTVRGINPLTHFLEVGAQEGRNPNPLFDTKYYLRENPDVLESGMNPLQHFVASGCARGLKPNPLFDSVYYVVHNPDVAATGKNPLAHFLEFGAKEGRWPNPLFDSAYYLEQNADVQAAGLNPLAHFLEFGAREGRKPNSVFEPAYYLRQNPDVEAAGLNPLAHFLMMGSAEGRRPCALFDPIQYAALNPEVTETGVNSLAHFLEFAKRSALEIEQTKDRQKLAVPGPAKHPNTLVPLSVVIPTFNRSELLVGTVQACHRHSGGCELEIVVVDDGSTDDTVQRLAELSATIPNLTWRSVGKVGPGKARNIGAEAARHDVLLFLGDDIRPMNDDFFRVHARLHGEFIDNNLAVLGKVVWPDMLQPITYTMAHVQGEGAQQFGYIHLTPYSFVTWASFYTANVSVKKALVQDWILNGFDENFTGAAFEDLEFAYRFSNTPKGLKIFYDPAARASHHHPYKLAQFMDRQTHSGEALAHFIELHPETVADFNVRDIVDALRAPKSHGEDQLLADHRALIDGLKALAKAVEADGQLGSEHWHSDFLSAVLDLCLVDGFVSAWPAQHGDLAAVTALMLDRFCLRMRQSLPREFADWNFLVKLIPQAAFGLLWSRHQSA
jgi:glycosyltransferase involved in cell wall biosynthesis